MATTVEVECVYCGQSMSWSRDGNSVIPIGGTYVVSDATPICEECVERTLDGTLNGPTLSCLREITYEWAKEAVVKLPVPGHPIYPHIEFLARLFDYEARITAAGAMRVHNEGEPREARALLARARRTDATRGYLAVQKASMLLAEGGADKAAALLESATPEDHQCFYLIRGDLRQQQGRHNEALDDWRKQIVLGQEGDYWAFIKLGNHLLSEAADYPAAERHYKSARERYPEDPFFAAYLGEALRNQGKHGDALEAYDLAIAHCGERDADFQEQVKAIAASIRR